MYGPHKTLKSPMLGGCSGLGSRFWAINGRGPRTRVVGVGSGVGDGVGVGVLTAQANRVRVSDRIKA
jgi:hypothetical protein